MKHYPALIAWNEADKVFDVRFPDIPEAFSYGKSLEEAKKNAAEVLALMLEDADAFPEASSVAGADYYSIPLDSAVAFTIWLKSERRKRGLTQTEVADRLGVKYQVYQKLEKAGTANPTLKTLVKLEQVFGDAILAI